MFCSAEHAVVGFSQKLNEPRIARPLQQVKNQKKFHTIESLSWNKKRDNSSSLKSTSQESCTLQNCIFNTYFSKHEASIAFRKVRRMSQGSVLHTITLGIKTLTTKTIYFQTNIVRWSLRFQRSGWVRGQIYCSLKQFRACLFVFIVTTTQERRDCSDKGSMFLNTSCETHCSYNPRTVSYCNIDKTTYPIIFA